MLNNLNFNFSNIKSFSLFECENFFSEDFYKDLSTNFPLNNEGDINTKILKDQRNKKFVINNEMSIYHELLKKNIAMKKLDETVISQDFINFIYNKLYFHFIKSKFRNIKDLIKLLKRPKLIKKEKINNFFNQEINVTIEYSYILNSGKIVPHTDNPSKLLSLMLYFPEYQDEKEKLKKKEEEIGTIFWKSNTKNFSNIHQFGNLEKEFIEDKSNQKIFQTKFKGNHLYGFVKNESSWHSVDEVDMHDNYIRKSININFHF